MCAGEIMNVIVKLLYSSLNCIEDPETRALHDRAGRSFKVSRLIIDYRSTSFLQFSQHEAPVLLYRRFSVL